MEAELNLIPDYRKEEIKRSRRFWLAVRIEISVIAIFLIFIVMLESYNITLKLNLESYSAVIDSGRNNQPYEKMKRLDEKFTDANDRLNEIMTIKDDQLYWYNVFYGLNDIDSSGIVIDSLATDNMTISMVGQAGNREDLITFKSKVEANDCFSEVKLPLSNLVKKENIDFQMDMAIKEDCLKKVTLKQ